LNCISLVALFFLQLKLKHKEITNERTSWFGQIWWGKEWAWSTSKRGSYRRKVVHILVSRHLSQLCWCSHLRA
jgi:hypothetical protein